MAFRPSQAGTSLVMNDSSVIVAGRYTQWLCGKCHSFVTNGGSQWWNNLGCHSWLTFWTLMREWGLLCNPTLYGLTASPKWLKLVFHYGSYGITQTTFLISVATVMTNVFLKNGIMVFRKLVKIVRIFLNMEHIKDWRVIYWPDSFRQIYDPSVFDVSHFHKYSHNLIWYHNTIFLKTSVMTVATLFLIQWWWNMSNSGRGPGCGKWGNGRRCCWPWCPSLITPLHCLTILLLCPMTPGLCPTSLLSH